MKTKKIIPCVLLVISFLLPVLFSNPVQATTNYEPQLIQDELLSLGTIEAIVSNVDPWGGVRNDITSFQNATKFGYTHLDQYMDIVENQALTKTGFVSMAQLEIAQQTHYPNGVIGGPMAALTIIVNPILVLTAIDPVEAYVVSPTVEGAIALANEVAAQYEIDLGINFERLTVTAQASSYFFGFSVSSSGGYEVQYVSLPDEGQGAAAMNALRSRLSLMGGFMDLVDAPGWPVDDSILSESLFFEHHSDATWILGGTGDPYVQIDFAAYLLYANLMPYVRAPSDYPEYVETFNLGVLGMAGFSVPSYIQDNAGDETYSLKQHIGYSGNIQSKGYQQSSIAALSSIAVITPNGLDISGPPSTWEHYDQSTNLGNSYEGHLYDPDVTIPAYATVDELVKAYVIWYPRSIGMSVANSIFGLSSTNFDIYIDSIWGTPGSWPDYNDLILGTDFTELALYYNEYGGEMFEDLNRDLLRAIMENAGLTADAFLNHIDDSIFELSPTVAMMEAFISFFDSYNLLDILEGSTYSNPVALEAFLNGYISDIEDLLIDFAGIDLPSSYETKEAFADLIEDHFGLVLQGLWDAMAAFTGDTTDIKNAVSGMAEPDHLIEEIFPYFWADLYSSVVSEYDYALLLNFDIMDLYMFGEFTNLATLNVNDVVLTFDLDRDGVTYDGPHLIVEKTVVDRELLEGELLDVTITVKNVGSATAYDIKVLDGISPGFNSDKQYYWNKATLVAGETWTLNVVTAATDIGKYAEIPTIVCYFNATLDSFDADLGPDYWDGAAMYTTSEIGNQISVINFWDQLFFGVPYYIAVGGSGVAAGAIIVLAVVIKKRASS